jgi:predicted lipoprotein with Yx(FWY)xxD motif
MIRLTITALSATLLLAACGDDDQSKAESPSTAVKEEAAMKEDAAMKRKGTLVKVVDSQYGRVIADRTGEAVYLFDKEKRGRSECYGACAKAWPPLLAKGKGKPRAGTGAKAKLLGTTKRRGGARQVTYRGQPLYYYKDDSPGRILCQNVDEFGGLWLVVKPSGRPVT